MPSADEFLTQGDVDEEIDLLRYLNVEDLKIGTLLASTREHPLVFAGVTGIIADALERRHDVARASLGAGYPRHRPMHSLKGIVPEAPAARLGTALGGLWLSRWRAIMRLQLLLQQACDAAGEDAEGCPCVEAGGNALSGQRDKVDELAPPK